MLQVDSKNSARVVVSAAEQCCRRAREVGLHVWFPLRTCTHASMPPICASFAGITCGTQSRHVLTLASLLQLPRKIRPPQREAARCAWQRCGLPRNVSTVWHCRCPVPGPQGERLAPATSPLHRAEGSRHTPHIVCSYASMLVFIMSRWRRDGSRPHLGQQDGQAAAAVLGQHRLQVPHQSRVALQRTAGRRLGDRVIWSFRGTHSQLWSTSDPFVGSSHARAAAPWRAGCRWPGSRSDRAAPAWGCELGYDSEIPSLISSGKCTASGRPGRQTGLAALKRAAFASQRFSMSMPFSPASSGRALRRNSSGDRVPECRLRHDRHLGTGGAWDDERR